MTRTASARARPAACRAALLLAAAALAACQKFEYLPDDQVVPVTPRVLLHRGSGTTPGYVPNTVEAMLYGAGALDGVEMDLQLSADGTLWLGHDNEVLDCAGQNLGCFQDLSDDQIAAVATCGGVGHYDTLDETLRALAAAYPQRLFALDVKGQYCRSLGLPEAQRMAEEVDRLVRAAGLGGHVLAETEQRAFAERLLELGAPVLVFWVSLGDIDVPLSEAAAMGAAGISFKWGPDSEPLTPSVVDGIHGVGQRIVTWTINGEADARAAWAAGPDVIETDEAGFYGYLAGLPSPL